MTDIDALWDFSDPTGSEQRFRARAHEVEGVHRRTLLTQVARALGLQERFDEGHAVLDAIEAEGDFWYTLGDRDRYPLESRIALERGRLLNSAGRRDEAREAFGDAGTLAREAGDDALEVDALHMEAIVAAEPAEAVKLNREALAVARRSADPAARRWEASLLNNLGCALVDTGRPQDALPVFERAVAAREARGQRRESQIARWMVGWALRLLGRREEALAVQQSLKAELTAEGTDDPYVDEELALLGHPGT